MYLACALAASYRLGWIRTLAALAVSGAAIIVSNAVRACALFYAETGLIALPDAAHPAIGMVCFVAAALMIFAGVRHIARSAP
ncbi:hypothetical protein LP420_33025 [Massilia sp. B-10]|nr:hypothetical protein LP420_33025 [Massilia sp. B-10]